MVKAHYLGLKGDNLRIKHRNSKKKKKNQKFPTVSLEKVKETPVFNRSNSVLLDLLPSVYIDHFDRNNFPPYTSEKAKH